MKNKQKETVKLLKELKLELCNIQTENYPSDMKGRIVYSLKQEIQKLEQAIVELV